MLQPSISTSASMYWYQQSYSTSYIMLFLGGLFLIVNLASDGLFDVSGGCTDPYIRTSIAPIGSWKFSPLGVSMAYQWLFALYCGTAVVIGFGVMTAILKKDDPKHRAKTVYRCIHILACDPDISAAREAIQQWKDQMLGCEKHTTPIVLKPPMTRVPLWRRILFYWFHLPFLLLASLPAIGFVLAGNVPKGISPLQTGVSTFCNR